MRGRIGGDIAALGAHLGRQLIFGATAIGAATNGRASGRSSFRRSSAKVGEGGSQTLQKSVSEPPGDHCMIPFDSQAWLPALYVLPAEKIVFDGQ